MINKIFKKDYSDKWDEWLDNNIYDTEESGMYIKFILEFSEEYEPDFPELWGFWQTEAFDRDELIEDAIPYDDVEYLVRTTRKTKIVEQIYWEPVEE